MLGKSIATSKQVLRDLNIETKASVMLNDGATAFHKGELTKSANLFLRSWRTLQNEQKAVSTRGWILYQRKNRVSSGSE
jgi:hypothetical protein